MSAGVGVRLYDTTEPESLPGFEVGVAVLAGCTSTVTADVIKMVAGLAVGSVIVVTVGVSGSAVAVKAGEAPGLAVGVSPGVGEAPGVVVGTGPFLPGF